MKGQILLPSLILLILFAATPIQTAGLDTGYSYWSLYKPGTMVSFRCLTTGNGSNRAVIRTFTLASVGPDLAIVESKEVPAPVAGASASHPSQPVLLMRLEFRASAFNKEKEDLFGLELGNNVEILLSDEDKVVVGAEAIPLKGHRLQTTHFRILKESSGVRTEFNVWACPEIPGRLVKLVREIRAGTTMIRDEIMAVDFLALSASGAEVAGLKASRKPEWVEVSGLEFIKNETRCIEDWQSLEKEAQGYANALNRIIPSSSNSDWSEFNKRFFLSMEKSAILNTHLEEDRPKAEAKLPEPERQKLNPFFESVGLYADLFVKSQDKLASALSLAEDPAKRGDLSTVLEELKSLALEFRSTYVRFEAEFKKLISMRLKYMR